jgi:flagellar motor switch protein FliG
MGEFCMGNGKTAVITVYGHNKVIDKIAVSQFDKSEGGYYSYSNDSNAKTYCDTINTLKLEGESWVFAKIVSENTQYTLDAFLPLKFDTILNLDDKSVQKILREVDYQEIAKALKGENEAIQEKIFNNMSRRAAQMLKEDMKFMGPIRIIDIKEAQEKILNIIRHLEQTGEIVIAYSKGETTE